jgi:hypothetical protein
MRDRCARAQGLHCRGLGRDLGGGLAAALVVASIGPGVLSQAAEPAEPSAASLAPVDREWLRQQYGQEALFRLRLGVDAGERDAAERDPGFAGGSGGCSAVHWPDSPQQRRYAAALRAGHFFEAGQALGQWRRWCLLGG